MWRKGNTVHWWWECRFVVATVESGMEIPPKIRNGSAFWPRDPTSGNISKATNTNLKEHKHPYVHCSVIYNCQDMKAAQVSINRWMVSRWDIYTMEYFSAIKKEENFTLSNSMDGPGEHYAKWNKPVRERQIPYDFTHVESNEQTEQGKWGQTHRQQDDS